MKRLSATIALFLSLASALLAQPSIQVQDTVNWGRIVPKTKGQQPAEVFSEVIIRNTGNETLVINDIRTSCGCTDAPVDAKEIPPGGSTTMRVGFRLPETSGPVSKHIDISSNDPLVPEKTITLYADVQHPFQVSSTIIPFNRGAVGDTILGAVTLTTHGTDAINVKLLSFNEKVILYSPSEFTLSPGSLHELRVGYIANKPGAFSIQLMVTTDLPGYESFNLSGYGFADDRKQPSN